MRVASVAQHQSPAYLVGEQHCCVDNRSSKQGDFEVEHFVCGDKKGAAELTASQKAGRSRNCTGL